METADYSIYLPPSATEEAWGVGVAAAGHTRVPAGVAYPPGPHPADHALSWVRGRVLRGGVQIVYISEGCGVLDADRAGGRRRIAPGTVFQLFAGVWHRYRPDPASGWVEDWLELRGPVIDRLMATGQLCADRPVTRVGYSPEVSDLFRRCHRLVRDRPDGFESLLGAIGHELLVRVQAAESPGSGRRSGSDGVQRAMSLIANGLAEPVSMDRVADAVGMSYTRFRRAFRDETGMTPKGYQLQLRLRRAEDLLARTPQSLKEIAASLGFDSASHLSADFKARTGVAPGTWRRRHGGVG